MVQGKFNGPDGTSGAIGGLFFSFDLESKISPVNSIEIMRQFTTRRLRTLSMLAAWKGTYRTSQLILVPMPVQICLISTSFDCSLALNTLLRRVFELRAMFLSST